jgi:hypothetical protein
MKLEVGLYGLTIKLENEQDKAYVRDTLKLRNAEDKIYLVAGFNDFSKPYDLHTEGIKEQK